MYEFAKYIVKKLLPRSVIRKQGSKLRRLYGALYRGNKHECNICDTKLKKFIKLKTNDLICPNCGSLPRTRGLWMLIQKELENKRVLHFSPSPALKQVIQKRSSTLEYLTTDYEDEFESELELNIENMTLEDNSFDVIVCYHILEHVIDDVKALQELHRILKENGVCYIQTPFREGSILEDYSVTDPLERLRLFGQKDHVRVYSPKGLVERMENAGLKTETIEILNENDNYYGLKSKDIILKGRAKK